MHDHEIKTDPTAPSRDGSRTRQETEGQRRKLHDETRREVDRIAAEAHARLPRDQAKHVGAIYARFSTRFQASIADQVRACYESAVALGVFVPAENVLFDLATRGCKRDRVGLGGLHALLVAGAVSVMLAFTTNRLHRKLHRCLQFVEEEVVERGIRAVFPKSNIDTADAQRWKMLLNFNAMMDEVVVSMNTENIKAAQEGLFDRRLVFGTVTFGYRGDPIPGEFTKRERPRRRLAVDPESGPAVDRVFRWFADDLATIDEIARRLNDDPAVPLPPRSRGGAWTHRSVRALLANPRYRGYWEYGKTRTVWQSKQDYARQVARDVPLRGEQIEELRIVADELWHRAQSRLVESPSPAGRKPEDGDRRSRPRLLNGLFRCPTHDRALYVGGAHGHSMFCKDCQGLPAAERPLFSLLNRSLALRMTCLALADLVRRDHDLAAMVVAACRDEAGRIGRPDPARIDRLIREGQKFDRQIQFLLQNAGETEVDQREAAESLRALRRNRNDNSAAVARLVADRDRPVVIPAEAEVVEMLDNLGSLLEAAASAEGDDANAGLAREVVRSLTGGRIDLEQCGERGSHRGWLRGRFRVRLLPYLIERATGAAAVADGPGVEVVVEYREPTPSEALADRVKALCDQGKLIKEAAAELGVPRDLAAKALDHWHDRDGSERPDGRSRRTTLARKSMKDPKHVAIADEVKRLCDQGLLLQDIAARLGCDRNVVTWAIAYWHESRGLPVPDGRSRRKELDRPCSQPYPPRALRREAEPPAA